MKTRKFILAGLLISLLFLTSCSQKEVTTEQIKILQNASQTVDDILSKELQRLKTLAKKDSVLVGNWEIIKESLGENESERIKTLYWYSLPDGSYYTSAKGKVDANLSDREYFPKLKQGKSVVGYPIIGKTSGRKSIVIAVPVIKEDEVVGMLGSSIFLEDLWIDLKNKVDLPEDYDFYAINSKGVTIFDLESKELLLNDTLEESSTSLVEAVKKIMATENGKVKYSWNEIEKIAIYNKSKMCDWRYVLSFR